MREKNKLDTTPGGFLIFREHDATEDLVPLLDLAHGIFNLVTGVSKEMEANEYRAFRTVDEWLKILVELVGFENQMLYGLQKDDSTMDYMICVRKPLNSDDGAPSESVKDYFYKVKDVSAVTSVETHYRLPEWMLVDVCKEFASFLDHTPWYKFPYLSYIGLYLKLVFVEMISAMEKHGFMAAVFSNGLLMDTIIGIVLIVMFLQLFVLSLPLRMIFGTKLEKHPIYTDFNTELVVVKHVSESNEMTNEELKAIDDRIEILGYSNDIDEEGRVLKIPQHGPFTDILLKLSEFNDVVRIESISSRMGDIQVEFRLRLKMEENEENNLNAILKSEVDKYMKDLASDIGSSLKILCGFQYPTEMDEWKRFAVLIRIPFLLTALKILKAKEQLEITKIFNF